MNILGIDYGNKRIGLALSNGTFASGMAKLATNEAARLKHICLKHSVDLIVIGLPEGRLREKVKRFGTRLKKELLLPIRYWDETLTSSDARKSLVRSGVTKKKRRFREHQTAAAIMLQAYIDTNK